MAEAPEQPWTEADTVAARAAIPHLRPGLVHLNNAGCSIPTQATLAAVQDYLARWAVVAAVGVHCDGLPFEVQLAANGSGSTAGAFVVSSRQRHLASREASDGGYETFDASAAALERPYTALAALLNCRPEEIAVLTSATAAWQQVLYGLAWGWRPGDRVLTSVHEYGSNAIALLQLARWGGAGGAWGGWAMDPGVHSALPPTWIECWLGAGRPALPG